MAAAVLPQVEALLSKDAAALEEQWAGLSDEALLEEINKYRDAVRAVSVKLSDLGARLFGSPCLDLITGRFPPH